MLFNPLHVERHLEQHVRREPEQVIQTDRPGLAAWASMLGFATLVDAAHCLLA
jgi:hypothetical protein